jgi:rhomboid protease GluP
MATIRQTILCPACRRLISRDEATCPWCGATHPGAWWRRGFGVLSGDNPLMALKVIIAINVGMFLISLLLNQSLPGQARGMFGALTPDQNSLFALGATGTIPVLQFGRIWSLVNAGYLHGGIMHILFNMMAIYQIFPMTAREYGTSRTITIYCIGGLAGFLLSVLAGIPFTIGASAPVCGLIGALLYYGKSRGGSWGEAVSREVMGWIIGLALFGFMLPGINNWGHAGGIAGGALAGFVLRYRERQPETALHQTFAVICALATLLSLGWGLTEAAISFLWESM